MKTQNKVTTQNEFAEHISRLNSLTEDKYLDYFKAGAKEDTFM